MQNKGRRFLNAPPAAHSYPREINRPKPSSTGGGRGRACILQDRLILGRGLHPCHLVILSKVLEGLQHVVIK